jgi:hypothetical protein
MTEQVQTPVTTEQPVAKKARKQRSDKGQKRGPYKPKVVSTEG